MPLLPLRGLTVFPYMVLHFDVGREKSIKALEEAMINNQLIFLVTQKDARNDLPEEDDIYTIGTISKVKQLLKLPGDTIRVLVEGMSRAQICEFTQKEPFFMAEVEEKIYYMDEEEDWVEIEALKRRVVSVFEKYSKLNTRISPETVLSITSIEDPDQLADIITSNLMLKSEQKQEILNEFQSKLRLQSLLEILVKEIDIMQVERI